MALIRRGRNEDVPYETLRFDFPPVCNALPVRAFGCSPAAVGPHDCTGETFWRGRCQCRCHLADRSQVK